MQNTKRIALGRIIVIAIIVTVAPFTVSEYKADVLTTLLINIILVASFRLITTTGGWSLAHIPMMGAGAYATALMSTHWGCPFLISLPLASLIAGLVGMVVSYPLSKTKGFSFFVASFAAGEAIRLCWIRFKFPFGGHRGVSNIKPPDFIPGLDFSEAIPYYFLTLVVTIICLMIMYRIDRSRVGNTFKVIESQEDLSNSLGINTTRYKMLAFAIGSCFAGTAGVMLAHRLWAIEPHQFGFMTTLYLLVWVVFGGTHTFWGPIIGVVVMTILGEILNPLAEWIPFVYGAIIILTLHFLPEGLEGLKAKTGLRLGNFWKIRISFEK